MLDGREYSPSEGEPFGCMNTLTTTRKKRNKNKRRFSDEQIRSLESMFESETRLEPRKKLQLAKELGLQPRQVAIWFQNKRARWKSKQLERDYSILRANYNSLASRFETLKKEKQALAIQVIKYILFIFLFYAPPLGRQEASILIFKLTKVFQNLTVTEAEWSDAEARRGRSVLWARCSCEQQCR